jgi:O-methyltransferase domain
MTERRPRISFQAIAQLAELADYTIPFTIRAICKLGIADCLTSGPRSIEDLSESLGAHAPSLLRAMRALVSRGVFVEPQPGRFELNPIAELLQTDHPLSMRYAFRLAPDLDALADIAYTLRTGEPSFEHLFDEDYFAYLSTRPELLAEFHASQRALTRLEQVLLLRSYDWSTLRIVVDIGGGDGTFLGLMLAANPRVRGILFDLPNTVMAAPQVLANYGVANRCEIIGGSFFDAPVPTGADAYLIKRVLVGLDDEQVITLFAAVRAAMHPNSRLLICEPMMSEGDISAAMDLLMLVLGPGHVRTPAEFERLFTAADLQLTRGITTPMFPFIEARPISHARDLGRGAYTQEVLPNL